MYEYFIYVVFFLVLLSAVVTLVSWFWPEGWLATKVKGQVSGLVTGSSFAVALGGIFKPTKVLRQEFLNNWKTQAMLRLLLLRYWFESLSVSKKLLTKQRLPKMHLFLHHKLKYF